PTPAPAQSGDRSVPTSGRAGSVQAPELAAVGAPGLDRASNAATPTADAAPIPRAAPEQLALPDPRCGAVRRTPNRLPGREDRGVARLADVPTQQLRRPAGGAVAPARYGRRLDRHSTATEPRTQPMRWQRPVAAPPAQARRSAGARLRCAHYV